MHRFELNITWSSPHQRAIAVGALTQRYPEIEVLRIDQLMATTERWVCTAPGVAHLQRWTCEQAVDARFVDPQPPPGR